MQTLTVGNLKTNFSEVLTHIRQGKEYGISYGKKKEPMAVIIPINNYLKLHPKRLGSLEKPGQKIIIKKNFKMTTEEFLKS